MTGRGICRHVAKKHLSGVVLPRKVKRLMVCHPECSAGSLQVFLSADRRGNFIPHCSLRPSCFIYLSDAAQGGEAYAENLFAPVLWCG